jgi:ubiquinone/menaquinone biosynthesis C-methylase UbiE
MPKDLLKRAILEYKYFSCKGWSIKEVGDFWESINDYDDINENTYSYYRRFSNSWDLAKNLVKDGMVMLDIQSRSGKGTEFWFKKGLIKQSYMVDFSDHLLNIAKERLKDSNYDCKLVKVLDYNLPFDNDFFDLIGTYETIEHMGDVDLFMNELSRVLKPDGIMILTCPNILWEPVHWLAAIFNIHHSEGPHNFLRRKKLLELFEKNNLNILKENTTIFLPFNNKHLIAINEKFEKDLPKSVVRVIGLRRSFILRKTKMT